MTKPNARKKRRMFKVIGGLLLTGVLLSGAGVMWISYQVKTLAFLGEMPACTKSVAHLGGAWGTAAISVELAQTDAEREKGLMFREQLSPDAGMLFVYPRPQTATFWMRNTLIPLDILFFDGAGNLRHVHFNAQPYDETPIPGGNDIQYVIEIAAGETMRLGIGPQTTLRHPALDQSTARWNCGS